MEQSHVNRLVESCLRDSSDLLRRAVRAQLDATLEAQLDLRPLLAHLDSLAQVVAVEGLGAAGSLHREFTVVPHAQWLGRKKRRYRQRDSYREAGRKGGASRSRAKVAAAKANGAKGGRPRFDDEPFVQRLVNWAINPLADPDYAPEVAKSALQSIPRLSVRLRRKIMKRLAERHIDVEQFRDVWEAARKKNPAVTSQLELS